MHNTFVFKLYFFFWRVLEKTRKYGSLFFLFILATSTEEACKNAVALFFPFKLAECFERKS